MALGQKKKLLTPLLPDLLSAGGCSIRCIIFIQYNFYTSTETNLNSIDMDWKKMLLALNCQRLDICISFTFCVVVLGKK